MTINAIDLMERPLSEEMLAMVGVMEEGAEVVKILCKLLRFGNGINPKTGEDNRHELAGEVGDLIGCTDMLINALNLDVDVVLRHRVEHPRKMRRYNLAPGEARADFLGAGAPA